MKMLSLFLIFLRYVILCCNFNYYFSKKKKVNIIDKFWLIPPTHLFFKVEKVQQFVQFFIYCMRNLKPMSPKLRTCLGISRIENNVFLKNIF